MSAGESTTSTIVASSPARATRDAETTSSEYLGTCIGSLLKLGIFEIEISKRTVAAWETLRELGVRHVDTFFSHAFSELVKLIF
jgi:hypothetical protein